jgi:two-component system chemotaxis response regulator CheY
MTQCLIIDSTLDGRSELASLLTRYGFELDSVSDAADALDRCRVAMPDVIVMAEQAGTMDSDEFLQRLHGSRPRSAPKVIVYSDAPDAGSMGRHIWTGAAECMVRPFDADIIDLKLRQVGVL